MCSRKCRDEMNDHLKETYIEHSSQEILNILHSIKQIELDNDGCILVKQDADTSGAYITSFEPDSFTYELLALIEKHMKKVG